jgi:hypothetical protein
MPVCRVPGDTGEKPERPRPLTWIGQSNEPGVIIDECETDGAARITASAS